MFKFLRSKIIFFTIVILFVVIGYFYIFVYNFLFDTENFKLENLSKNKEEIYLTKYIDFNSTFYKDNNKLKFLYNSYNSLD